MHEVSMAWTVTDSDEPLGVAEDNYFADEDFQKSEIWQSWLQEHAPREFWFAVVVEDRKDTVLKGNLSRPNSEKPSVSNCLALHVPASEFRQNLSNREVFRRVRKQLFEMVAEKFGWEPPPTELPPVADIID